MVRFQSDPAGLYGSMARRCFLCMAACLLLSQWASGQVMPLGNGTMASPNGVFGAPQTAFGPDSFDPGHELLPIQGDQEQGALRQVQYSQSLGEYGSMSVYGAPDGDNPEAGLAFTSSPSSWLYVRDLQAAVYSNPEQTVVNGGTTFTLYASDCIAVGGRALLGRTVDDDLDDEMHFSGDAFGGFRLPGELWIKGGFLYDMQDDFYKYGPTFGAVLMADANHPITVDFAYGMGQGDIRANKFNTGVVGIADDDVQLRVGTYVSRMLQVGLSGQWARWDNAFFEDDEGIGGFIRMSVADLDITVDVTSGDIGTRGFCNIAYVFGGPNRRSWRDGDACAYVDRPQDWLTRPVMRDSSLRIQERLGVSVPGGNGGNGGNGQPPGPPGPASLVGNVTQVAYRIQVDPGADQINPGVVDPGDGFSLLVTLGNGSQAAATNVSITNITTTAAFVTFNSPPNEVIPYPNLPGGGSQATNLVPSTPLGIDPTATQGSTFAIDFDVAATGQVRRFRAIVTLGTSGNATPAVSAIPLN
jgi:hypothetical protein